MQSERGHRKVIVDIHFMYKYVIIGIYNNNINKLRVGQTDKTHAAVSIFMHVFRMGCLTIRDV